jgi:hypothetical protein
MQIHRMERARGSVAQWPWPDGNSSISSSIAIGGQFFHPRRKTNTAKKNGFASADSLSGFRCGMPE